MKKRVKILLIAAIIIGVGKLPILHQSFPDGKVYFSLVDAIQSDIDEKQFITPYFIATSMKDYLSGDF